MRLLPHAILAALPVLFGVGASDLHASSAGVWWSGRTVTRPGETPGPPVDAPMQVRFQLADGVRVAGELREWDDDGIDGSFGRRRWIDLAAADIWKLYQRVMDRNASDDWVNLGRVMLLASLDQPRAGDRAEQAFRRALEIDANATEAIEAVRAEVDAAERKRIATERAAATQRLTTVSPEAGPWPADPWPVLSAAEQAAALLAMRSDAEKVVQGTGAGALAPLETDHFLLYTDVDRRRAAEWLVMLERAHGMMEQILDAKDTRPSPQAPPNFRGYWGKVVIFLWKDADRFKLVEAESFQHLVSRATIGVCHPVGPRIFMNFRHNDDEEALLWALVHESVHAFMHRYRTPRRPPPWANDGWAEFMTSLVLHLSPIAEEQRQAGIAFIRGGINVPAIFDLKYDDESWPGPKNAGLRVSPLIVELMVKEKGGPFIRWLIAVKDGAEWQPALREHYGVTREGLIEVATQYYRVND